MLIIIVYLVWNFDSFCQFLPVFDSFWQLLTTLTAYDSLSGYDSFWLPSGLSSFQGLRRACLAAETPLHLGYLFWGCEKKDFVLTPSIAHIMTPNNFPK